LPATTARGPQPAARCDSAVALELGYPLADARDLHLETDALATQRAYEREAFIQLPEFAMRRFERRVLHGEMISRMLPRHPHWTIREASHALSSTFELEPTVRVKEGTQ
jgi:hypothetical protein